MTGRGFSRGSKDRLGEFIALTQSRRQRVTRYASRRLIVLPSRTLEIPADDALHRKNARSFRERRATSELWVTGYRLGHLSRVGRDQMIRRDILQLLEPEGRDRGEHLSLALDRRRQYAVERRETIG